MTDLPSGTVTFLFTDMEGSTRLLAQLGRAEYGRVLAEHHRLLRAAFEAHGGIEVDTQGDAFFVVFRTAADAVAAAVAGQRALGEHEWPDGARPRVRMGLHTGEALLEGGRYVGVAVHRAQRVSSAAHGGQVLLSNSTRELVADELPAAVVLRDLGLQQLKDLDRPERVFQLEAQGLRREFPAIRGAAPSGPRYVPRSTRGRLLAVGAAAAVVVAALAGIVLARGGGMAQAVAGDALVAIDPGEGKVTDRTDVGATPSVVTVGEGGVWTISADERTISHVDPASGDREAFALGSTPTDLAAGEGALWVGVGSTIPSAQAVGPIMTGLVQVDPATRTERGQSDLPRRGGAISNRTDQRVAVSEDAVWTVNPDYSISHVNPQTGKPTKTIRTFGAVAIAASGKDVWALGDEGDVAQIDPKRDVVRRRVHLRATALDALAVGEGAVWVTSEVDGTLWRIDLAGGGRPSAIPVGQGAVGVAVGEGSVWVTNPLRGTVIEVDPETNAVKRTIAVGGVPRAIAVGEGAVWAVATGTGGSVSARAAGGGLPRSFCEDVLFGGEGSPDLLIASDLPLQGGLRLSALQMSQAVAYVLRARSFKAGPYKVGYQSCDDSIARTGLYDPDKCAANARAYAANEKVVAVVGPLNSVCAIELIPVLNAAPGGGLALVGPTTSLIGLTRYGPGVPPGALAELYPAGRRTFFRVYPTDDYEGAALALLARRLGARRVAVLHDDDFFSLPVAESFRIAARRLGLRVTSERQWDQRAQSYTALARKVRAEKPQAVVIVGLLDTNGGQVARDVRAVLGPRVRMLASSGFTGIPTLFKRAGAETAKSMYVSLPGVVTQRLTPKARTFVRDFGATQRGTEVEPSAVYAAQAAEVLLDAIARSDGTRAGVLAELARTRVQNGLLGTFHFDRNGDTTLNPITILRPERPGGRTTIMSFSGAAIDRVLTPPARLVGD
jgi:branched-chain amino acid transport system substrate-binding protein